MSAQFESRDRRRTNLLATRQSRGPSEGPSSWFQVGPRYRGSSMNAVIGALLPLIVTLALGFFAAWRHEFTPEQALVLNRVVLLYALPLLLFAGTVTIKRGTLTGSLGLAAAITVAMVGAYLATFLVVRFVLPPPRGGQARRTARCGCSRPVHHKPARRQHTPQPVEVWGSTFSRRSSNPS